MLLKELRSFVKKGDKNYTHGTLIEEEHLETKQFNFSCLTINNFDFSLSWLDVSQVFF